MDENTFIKFGKWIDYSKSHPRSKFFPRKDRGLHGSRDAFKNFKPPSIFIEWMKVHSLNLASGSAMASPPQG